MGAELSDRPPSSAAPKAIGLTGGIASGKSSVTQHLAAKGAHIIDADRVGHEVIAPGGAAYQEVIDAFGPEIVAPDRTIDRRKLGAIVFGNKEKLQALNRISHPRMAARMAQEIAAVRSRPAAKRPRLIVLEAAILLEAGWDTLCDAVWAVEAPTELSISRLMARNNLSLEGAQARFSAQITNEERAARAHKVIRNTGSMDFLLAQVDLLWKEAAGAA
jgi:phosphopantetheine adenylyltransferase/dephospho-CoA kinase